jgi:hypothetical protein
MVVDSADYAHFIWELAQNPKHVLPKQIRQLSSHFLFIGYNATDLNLSYFVRSIGIAGFEQRDKYRKWSVLLPPEEGSKAQEYQVSLMLYRIGDVRVFWQSVQEFAVHLRKRWGQYFDEV